MFQSTARLVLGLVTICVWNGLRSEMELLANFQLPQQRQIQTSTDYTSSTRTIIVHVPSEEERSSNNSTASISSHDKIDQSTRRSQHNSTLVENNRAAAVYNIRSKHSTSSQSSDPSPPLVLKGPNLSIIGSLQRQLESHNLTLSARHQAKFHSKKQDLQQIFDEDHFFRPAVGYHGALALNDEYAYIHVWKNGGTTIQNQVSATKPVSPTPVGKVKQPYTMTFVRDPIDHFLSGWGECRYRAMKLMAEKKDCNQGFREACHLVGWNDYLLKLSANDTTTNQDAYLAVFQENMDRMISDWIQITKSKTSRKNKEQVSSCSRHSFPQANFLVQKQVTPSLRADAIFEAKQGSRQEIMAPTHRDWRQCAHKSQHLKKWAMLENLVLVADLRELDHVLPDMLQVPFDSNIESGKNSTARDSVPAHRARSWLSPETLVRICDFVAVDYYLFDFQPPKPCLEAAAKWKQDGHRTALAALVS